MMAHGWQICCVLSFNTLLYLIPYSRLFSTPSNFDRDWPKIKAAQKVLIFVWPKIQGIKFFFQPLWLDIHEREYDCRTFFQII